MHARRHTYRCFQAAQWISCENDVAVAREISREKRKPDPLLQRRTINGGCDMTPAAPFIIRCRQLCAAQKLRAPVCCFEPDQYRAITRRKRRPCQQIPANASIVHFQQAPKSEILRSCLAVELRCREIALLDAQDVERLKTCLLYTSRCV